MDSSLGSALGSGRNSGLGTTNSGFGSARGARIISARGTGGGSGCGCRTTGSGFGSGCGCRTTGSGTASIFGSTIFGGTNGFSRIRGIGGASFGAISTSNTLGDSIWTARKPGIKAINAAWITTDTANATLKGRSRYQSVIGEGK
jgi:hypothetical protein